MCCLTCSRSSACVFSLSAAIFSRCKAVSACSFLSSAAILSLCNAASACCFLSSAANFSRCKDTSSCCLLSSAANLSLSAKMPLCVASPSQLLSACPSTQILTPISLSTPVPLSFLFSQLPQLLLFSTSY